MSNNSKIIFSVVSHGQLHLIKDFLSDFRGRNFEHVSIILTLNIPEDESALKEFETLPITIIRNGEAKGFGANHNAAFSRSEGAVFVIVNPDIRLNGFDLMSLLALFDDPRVGAAAPVVLSSKNTIEDSARRFPTVVRVLRRAVFGRSNGDYTWGRAPIAVDWVAGMFVAFRPEAFEQVEGFDERYFLYFEDVDICRRLKAKNWSTMLQPATSVIHDAQRASRRSRQHLKWHLQGMLRFLFLARS